VLPMYVNDFIERLSSSLVVHSTPILLISGQLDVYSLRC
jgi:hypothetical protein